MKVVEIRSEFSGQGRSSARSFTAYEAGSAAAGCGLGCIREIVWIGLLILTGYLLLATCTGGL